MVKFLIKSIDGNWDFNNPIDIEFPNKQLFKTLTPNTEVCLVDYSDDLKINHIFKKNIILVIKSILSIYPNMFFDINPAFFENKDIAIELLNTAIRTLESRLKYSKTFTEDSLQKFKEQGQEYINTQIPTP